MKKTIYLFILFLLNVAQISAKADDSTPRILKLLPNLPKPILIEPAIPSNFTLVEYDQKTNMEYFWGPEGMHMDNQEAIDVPLIHVIKQIYINKANWKTAISQLKAHFPEGFKASDFQWGDYCGVAIEMMIAGNPQYLAQVYLNDEAGTVLIFRLMYLEEIPYSSGNMPLQSDLDFWYHFLKNTKEIL